MILVLQNKISIFNVLLTGVNCTGSFLLQRRIRHIGYVKTKKERRKNEYNIKFKKRLHRSGWWDIDERISSDSWGDGKIGYTIWIRRPDWHGKDAFSLTGGRRQAARSV